MNTPASSRRLTRKNCKLLALIVFFAFQGTLASYADGQPREKYFGVYLNNSTLKSNQVQAFVGLSSTLKTTRQGTLELDYPGKSQKQLHDAILGFVKTSPYDVLKDDDGTSRIHFRNFSYIGKKDKCMADLVALTIWGVSIKNGVLLIGWSRNDIYATIFDAQMQVTKLDEVVSVNEAPFNQYRLVQPSVVITHGRGILFTRKTPISLAYPDSVFDPKGNVVNAYNKEAIEDFYNSYVASLKTYLDRNLAP